MAKKSPGLDAAAKAAQIARMLGQDQSAAPASNGSDSPAATPSGGMLAALGAGNTQVRNLSVAEIAADPGNPREDLGDLSDLARSIKDNGLYQPILVTPVERFVEAHPEHVDAFAGKQYVVVMGHRRLAATLEAGLETIAATTKPTKDRLSHLTAQIEENIQRRDFNPFEEAIAFARLRDEGSMSQRQIATNVHVSPSHVHKRLSLLKLAQPIQDAVRHGRIAASDAINLAEEPQALQLRVFEVARAGNYLIATAVQMVADADATSAAVAANKAIAIKAGATVVTSEQVRSAALRPLTSDADVRSAAMAGNLQAVVTDKSVTYYGAGDSAQSSRASAAEIKAAATRRSAAAAEMAKAGSPSTDGLLDALSQVALDRAVGRHNDAVKMAYAWIGDTTASSPGEWIAMAAAAGPPTRHNAAWAVSVAYAELATQAAADSEPWSAHVASYVDRLIAHHAYTPAPWEAARLTAFTEQEN